MKKKKKDFFEDVDKYLEETKDEDINIPWLRKDETCADYQKRIDKKVTIIDILIKILYSLWPPL